MDKDVGGVCVCVCVYICVCVCIYIYIYTNTHTQNRRASLVAQWVKNLPAMQETWVHSPGQEAPLEKEMATHSSILAWSIQWTEEPSRL